jgi:hypothetical protein
MALAAPLSVAGDVIAVALAGPIHRMEPKLETQAKRLIAACKTMERRP